MRIFDGVWDILRGVSCDSLGVIILAFRDWRGGVVCVVQIVSLSVSIGVGVLGCLV